MLQTPSLRVRPKDTHWRIEEPNSRLCVRFYSIPAAADEAPRIVPKLVPGKVACWFVSRDQAVEFFTRFLAGQALEIVRFDA